MNKKRTILFISHKYPPAIGGMETQSYELIQQAEQNHTIHKLVYTGNESRVVFFTQLKKRIKKILNQHPDIDVIHLNDGLMGLFTLWLKKYTKVPVIITFHGLDLVFPNSWYQHFITQKYNQYDAAICVSRATAAECVKRNFPKQKVFVVPNGVNHQIAEFEAQPQKFKAQFEKEYGINLDGKKIITTLGRAVQRKGYSWFLKNVLPQLGDDVLLVMMGPIVTNKKTIWKKVIPSAFQKQIELASGGLNDQEQITDLLQDTALKSKVIQTGKLPYNQVLEMLSIADLFVMPNIKKWGDAEGFGLVALEASLRKTVVVASNLEGIPDAIQDGKNGILLKSEDAQSWAQNINNLLKDKLNLKQMGEQFQQFTLQNYSWKKMTQQYIQVFDKLINTV